MSKHADVSNYYMEELAIPNIVVLQIAITKMFIHSYI